VAPRAAAAIAAVAVAVGGVGTYVAINDDDEGRGDGGAAGGAAAEIINCMPDPSACGFPDVENTGLTVSEGSLTAVNGNVTLTTPGEVYENKLVHGQILVTAPNVTIRNVKVVCACAGAIRSFPGEGNTGGLVIEDSEIDLDGDVFGPGIGSANFTARRVFFHNGGDCGAVDDNTVIEDSLCVLGPDATGDGVPDSTDFCRDPGDPHFDGFQTNGDDNAFLHNTIRNPCPQTSAISVGRNDISTDNVQIRKNLMAGGGWTLYCNSSEIDVTNEHVTGNRFAEPYFSRSGSYGPVTGCNLADTYTGNVWDDDNSTVLAK
jgi:hypothetical protein